MRIILEGADGTGKTTLAKILANKYGLDICHCTQHDAADFNFYKETTRKDNVVWDRHTIGELIYPYIFGREQQLAVEDARIVVHYFQQQGGKIFVLTADDEVIKQRLLARGTEDHRIIKNYEKINDLFKTFAEAFCIPVIDTSKMTLNDIFNLMEKEN